jgi:hypothetical protein
MLRPACAVAFGTRPLSLSFSNPRACFVISSIFPHPSDFSLNFTVTNATGTGQVAVKIFTPPDEVVPFAYCFELHVPRNSASH